MDWARPLVLTTGAAWLVLQAQRLSERPLAAVFSEGVIWARPYEFLAMMDADDVCSAERLDRQVTFLKAHPDVALVGCWSRYVDAVTREVVFAFRPPCDPQGIRNALYINQCIVHPSWMVRTRAFRLGGLYSTAYPTAEGYELLRRLARRFKFANLSEIFLDYTISQSGISMRRRLRQLWDRLLIKPRYFELWQWRAWFDVARTIALFAVPRNLVAVYRRKVMR